MFLIQEAMTYVQEDYIKNFQYPNFPSHILAKQELKTLAQGFDEEVNYLKPRGFEKTVPEWQSVGKITFEYIDGVYPKNDPSERKVVFFMGGTGSGKTTQIQRLMELYPKDLRRISTKDIVNN